MGWDFTWNFLLPHKFKSDLSVDFLPTTILTAELGLYSADNRRS